jgi:RNA polymerase sigma factor for flagellar operon FliA
MGTPAETAYRAADGREGRIKDLVVQHLPLVTRIVNQLRVSLDSVISHDDLISAGTVGLVQAAHRFDASKGAKFATFAYRRIRGAVVDSLRENDWLGKAARGRLESVRACAHDFRRRNGRKATVAELARGADMSEQDVLTCLEHEKWDRCTSLDSALGPQGSEESMLSELIPDDGDPPLEELEQRERVERLAEAIAALPEREKQIIVMYYYEGLYMSEMAAIFSISESRVSQLHTRALYNLTRKMEGL